MTIPVRRVLLVTSDDEPATLVEAALEKAGHEIRRCFANRWPSFPCVGLTADGTCPLDDRTIDVVVDVRQHPWPRPTPRESGVLCALRDNIPLVVAGRTAFHPYDGWTQVSLDGIEGIAEACEEAIERSLAAHRDAAVAAVEAVLVSHELESRSVVACVHRSQGDLHVRIVAALPDELRSVVSARVGSALRSVDSTARTIEVELAG